MQTSFEVVPNPENPNERPSMCIMQQTNRSELETWLSYVENM